MFSSASYKLDRLVYLVTWKASEESERDSEIPFITISVSSSLFMFDIFK